MDTYSKQNKVFGTLEALLIHKSELQKEIEVQRLQISAIGKEITSPIARIINIIGAINKALNLVNGVQMGFKVASFIKNLFAKR
jgi:hypothetical protein